MAHVPFLIVVVCEMDVSVGAVGPIVVVSHGDDATDGEVATDMGVWAMLEGVSESLAIGTTWGGVVGE